MADNPYRAPTSTHSVEPRRGEPQATPDLPIFATFIIALISVIAIVTAAWVVVMALVSAFLSVSTGPAW